jgi:threonine synthase
VKAFAAGATPALIFQMHTGGFRAEGPESHRRFHNADILHKSGGTAVSVTDGELIAAVKEIGSAEGIFAAPEGAACLPALKKLLASGAADKDERIVLFNTGTGVKYLEALQS